MANLISKSQGFTLVSQSLVEIPEGLPLEGTDFGVGTNIGGTDYEFIFSWNGHHRYYSLAIARPDGILWKGYLEEDTPFLIRNFSRTDNERPDALVTVLDLDADEDDGTEPIPPRPSTLGKRHHLFVMRGIVE